MTRPIPQVRFDFDAVNRWAADPQRKQAIFAFTAGLERKVALLIERGGSKAPAPTIDHAQLLQKYMKLVAVMEGCTFADGVTDQVPFTDAERAELERIERTI